jgi:hypothetical protein
VSSGALADARALIAFFAADGATMTEAGLAAMQGDIAVSPITVRDLTEAGRNRWPEETGI